MNSHQEPYNGPIVYVVQESKLNLAKAYAWGKLVSLLPMTQNIVVSTQPCLRLLRQKLKDFTDNDFLLLVGDPVAIGMAVCVATEVNNGFARVLKFDRGLNNYFELEIDLRDQQGSSDELY